MIRKMRKKSSIKRWQTRVVTIRKKSEHTLASAVWCSKVNKLNVRQKAIRNLNIAFSAII